MLNLNAVILFSENPKELVEFYKKVLNEEPGWTGGGFTGFKVGNGFLTVGPHDKVKGKSTNPERMMFFFETSDVDGEYKRMLTAGATSVAAPYHPGEEKKMWLATLADLDGNMFQLNSPMKM